MAQKANGGRRTQASGAWRLLGAVLVLVELSTQVVRDLSLVRGGGVVAGASYTTSYLYDDLGRLKSATTPLGLTTSYDYDELDNLTNVTDPDGAESRWTYNHLGQVVDAIDPMGRIERTTYDSIGRQIRSQRIGSDGVVTQQVDLELDSRGNTVRRTDLGGGRTDYSYDNHDRLQEVAVWNSNSAADSSTSSYGYNYNGALTYQQDPNGNVVRIEVNAWDLQETLTEPATGTQAEAVFESVYDADGRIIEYREPNGNIVASTYSATGNLTREQGSSTWRRDFYYDADDRAYAVGGYGGTVYLRKDDRGLVLQSYLSGAANRDFGPETIFAYDADTRLVGRTEKLEGVSRTHTFTWTDQGELASHSDPVAGTTASYTYNDASQLTRVDWTNGATRRLDYFASGELNRDRYIRAGGGTRSKSEFVYDERGDIETERRYLYGHATRLHHYEYDRGGRLDSWIVTTAGGASTYDETTYDYDRAGNRIAETENGVTQTWQYDTRNRLVSSSTGDSYAYDQSGQLVTSTIAGVVTTNTWDGLGRRITSAVSGVGTVSYRYDSLDRLRARFASGQSQWFAHSGSAQDPSATYNFTDVDVDTVLYGRSPSGSLVSLQDGLGNQRIAGLNHHGDLAWLAPTTGSNPTETISYTPFGEVYKQWGADPDPELGFQGQYTDPSTGDTLMQARWYAPGTGTFRSRDTWSGDLNTPVTLNRFTYAGNNPIRYSDPTGYCFDVPGAPCDPTQLAAADAAWQASSHTKTPGATGTGKSTVYSHCVGKSDCRPMEDVVAEDAATQQRTAEQEVHSAVFLEAQPIGGNSPPAGPPPAGGAPKQISVGANIVRVEPIWGAGAGAQWCGQAYCPVDPGPSHVFDSDDQAVDYLNWYSWQVETAVPAFIEGASSRGELWATYKTRSGVQAIRWQPGLGWIRRDIGIHAQNAAGTAQFFTKANQALIVVGAAVETHAQWESDTDYDTGIRIARSTTRATSNLGFVYGGGAFGGSIGLKYCGFTASIGCGGPLGSALVIGGFSVVGGVAGGIVGNEVADIVIEEFLGG